MIAIKPFERRCRVGGKMRSMRMAALAVAMTLMFSGFALARDHDKDNNKHDHWDKHADRDRHHDEIVTNITSAGKIAIATTTGITTAGRIAITIETVNVWNVTIICGSVSAAATMATIAEGRFTPLSPELSGWVWLPRRRVWLSRFSVWPLRQRAERGLWLRLSGWQSYMHARDISQNKPHPNPRNEYGNRTHGYNGSFGDKNYYKAIQRRIWAPATKQTIVGEEAGRSSTWQFAISQSGNCCKPKRPPVEWRLFFLAIDQAIKDADSGYKLTASANC